MRTLVLTLCSVLVAGVAAQAQLVSPPDTTSINSFDLRENGQSISGNNLTAIPEPATYMLMGLGVLICAQQFRRKKT
jgi:hypothetical protein